MLDYLAATTAKRQANDTPSFERGSRADISRRAGALSFDRDEAERRIEKGIHFDDSFADFARVCASRGIALVLLTSGVQELVERYLGRRGVSVPVIGNAAEIRPDGWRVHFRDESVAGIDKRGFVERARREGRKAVAIGDDRSDFEAALVADVTFAKADSELAHFLDGRSVPYHAFRRFSEILERWPPRTW